MFSLFQSSLPSRYIFLIIVWFAFTVFSMVYPHSMELSHFRLLLDAQKINEGLYLYHSIYDYVGIIPTYFNACLINFFAIDGLAIKFFASLLILINAIYFNAIIDKYQLMNKRNFAPGLLVLIFSFIFYQNLDFSSILIGNLFITLAVSSLLKTGLESADVIGSSFKAGIYLGLAFLCDQSFILLLILGIITLQYYTSKGASYINLILGWSFPSMLLLIIYLLSGNHKELIHYSIHQYFTYTDVGSAIPLSFYFPWFILSLLAAFFFFIKRSSQSFKNYISKAHQVFVFWLIFGCILILFMKERQLASVYLLVNPLSFLSAFFLINIRRNWIKESIFIGLILFFVAFNFMIDSNVLVNKKVIEGSIVKVVTQKYDGKVLSLSDDISLYRTNTHGSSFTNWALEKSTFLNLIELGNLEKVYVGIIEDYPKYILDPNGIFDRIMERIPLFRKKYKKINSNTYRLI